VSESAPTVGEAVHAFIATEVGWDAGKGMRAQAEDLCAALGLDPSTPLGNVVALQPGQLVVEEQPPGNKDGQFFTLIRSALP
jgi:hypothetical protein